MLNFETCLIKFDKQNYTSIVKNIKMHDSNIKEQQKKRSFDKTLLDECIKRDNATIKDTSIHYNRESIITFICNCGQESSKRFVYLSDHSGAFCESCSKKNKTNIIKQTILKKYGVEHISQLKGVKEKAYNTMLQNCNNSKRKYYTLDFLHACMERDIATLYMETNNIKLCQKTDITFICKCEELYTKPFYAIADNGGAFCKDCTNKNTKAKMEETTMERYGVKNAFESEDIRNKIKEANIQKYGTAAPAQTEEIKKKREATTMERYGVKHISQLPSMQQKAKEAVKEKYGCDNVFQNKEIQEKSKETMLLKYGVEYSMQSLDIQDKQQKAAHAYKEYVMPSGAIRHVQGYEHVALDTLIKEHSIQESDIITDRKEIPRIEYTYNEQTKYYFPDIYIKSQDKIIEVKSSWTYEKDREKNEAKANACLNQGYKFQFWLYSKKGRKLTLTIKGY